MDGQRIGALLLIVGVGVPQTLENVVIIADAHIGVADVGSQIHHIVGLEIIRHIGTEGQRHVRRVAGLDRRNDVGVQLGAAAVKGGNHCDPLLLSHGVVELLDQVFQDLGVDGVGNGVPELDLYRRGDLLHQCILLLRAAAGSSLLSGFGTAGSQRQSHGHC